MQSSSSDLLKKSGLNLFLYSRRGDHKSDLTVQVPSLEHHMARTLQVDQIGKVQLELLLNMEVIFEDNTRKQIRVLVDTGAQANLLKRGVAPRHLVRRAQTPVRLVAANGQEVRAGDQEVVAHLVFHRRNAHGENEGNEKFESRFYVADTEVDGILSYPWLNSQQIGMFPHLDTLAKIHPEQKVLTQGARAHCTR